MSNSWGGKNPIPSKRVNNPGHEPFKGLSEEWSRFWMEPTVEVGETVQRETESMGSTEVGVITHNTL